MTGKAKYPPENRAEIYKAYKRNWMHNRHKNYCQTLDSTGHFIYVLKKDKLKEIINKKMAEAKKK